MADVGINVAPWWIQEWMNESNNTPDIPPPSSPPPSTVNMWGGEAPPQARPTSTPYSTPAYTPSPDFQQPSTSAGGELPPPPGSITDVPGGDQPLNDFPGPPGVTPDVLPAQSLTGDEPGATPPITETTGIPQPEFGPDNLYGPAPLYGTPQSPFSEATNWPGFFSGMKDLFGGIGNFFGNIFSSNPYPNIAPSGFPLGSYRPDAVASGLPLPGSFAGLGSGGGGMIGGGAANAVASQVAGNLRRGQATTFGYSAPALANAFMTIPGATRLGPANIREAQQFLSTHPGNIAGAGRGAGLATRGGGTGIA
jgi:hypothetical protein